MDATLVQYENENYLIIKKSSSCFYGKKQIYHVLTSNEGWVASKLPIILGYSPKLQSEALHKHYYEKNPTMENALRPYYKVTSHENDNYAKYDFSQFGIDSTFYKD